MSNPLENSAPPPEPEAVSTRERILEVAETLFAERGFAAVSVRDIAAGVGLNQASLYNHFPSKQALYEAVLEGGLAPIQRIIAEAARGVESEPAGDRFLVALLDHLCARPHLPKLLQREVLDDDEIFDRLATKWLEPIFAEGRATVASATWGLGWDEREVPFAVLALYHLIFGPFASRALMRRLSGVDPLDPAARPVLVEFLKRATRQLMELDSSA